MAKRERKAETLRTAGRPMRVDYFTIFTMVLIVLLIASQGALLVWLDLI